MRKEINPYMRGTLAICMAFHDFSSTNIKIKDFVSYIVGLFNEYGLEPTRMGITAPTNKSKSMNTYAREIKKLQTTPEEEIIAISLDATSCKSNERIFSLYFDKENLGQCVLALDNQFFSFDVQKVNVIFQKIIEFLFPNYGYSYQREFKKGPIWYPCGVLVGISSLPSFKDYSPEAELIDIWGKKYSNGTYKTGDLRDVYPINLLVDKHLTREISPDATFEQFIDSDKRHGTLEKIADEHYIWAVEEENIPFIREALRPSGMIIAG